VHLITINFKTVGGERLKTAKNGSNFAKTRKSVGALAKVKKRVCTNGKDK
jgi:hypothetical protein